MILIEIWICVGWFGTQKSLQVPLSNSLKLLFFTLFAAELASAKTQVPDLEYKIIVTTGP